MGTAALIATLIEMSWPARTPSGGTCGVILEPSGTASVSGEKPIPVLPVAVLPGLKRGPTTVCLTGQTRVFPSFESTCNVPEPSPWNWGACGIITGADGMTVPCGCAEGAINSVATPVIATQRTPLIESRSSFTAHTSG